MGFDAGLGVFLVYAAAILAVYFLGRILAVPLKIMLKMVLNGIIGGAVLMIINGTGADFGILIPVNFITALIAGMTGIPGITAMLLYYQNIL